MKQITMYQHMRAKNDTNGNPRRVFAFLSADGIIQAVEDEGYGGTPKACAGLVKLPDVEITATDRRQMLRDFPRVQVRRLMPYLTEAEEARRGLLLAEFLGLKPKADGLYHTTIGTKTALGLFRISSRVLNEGE